MEVSEIWHVEYISYTCRALQLGFRRSVSYSVLRTMHVKYFGPSIPCAFVLILYNVLEPPCIGFKIHQTRIQ
jgi:hypothetical protein